MFSIPAIESKCKIRVLGKIGKLYQHLIKEVINITVYKEKIENKNLEIEVIICQEAEMQKHNQEYLKKEGVTDVISLVYEKNAKEKHVRILGTILMCPNEIKRRSKELEKAYIKHLAHLTIHSTLHLLGHNHEEKEERKKMEAKEISVLSFLGIESPYLEDKKDHIHK